MILDHETKQALLTALDRRRQALVDEANDLLSQAVVAEAARDFTKAQQLYELAEQSAGRAAVVRRLWNDAEPGSVRVALLGSRQDWVERSTG